MADELQCRNINRVRKGLPEIDVDKEVKRIEFNKMQGKEIYRRLRLDGEHEAPADYLARVKREEMLHGKKGNAKAK